VIQNARRCSEISDSRGSSFFEIDLHPSIGHSVELSTQSERKVKIEKERKGGGSIDGERSVLMENFDMAVNMKPREVTTHAAWHWSGPMLLLRP